jgi:hypothetical protein
MDGLFYYLDLEKSRIFCGNGHADATKVTVLQRILPIVPCGWPREKLDNRGGIILINSSGPKQTVFAETTLRGSLWKRDAAGILSDIPANIMIRRVFG